MQLMNSWKKSIKNWIEKMNHKNLGFRMFMEEDQPSCIKGEWIYYPNGKLQNAIRSDKHRGHDDLIEQHYVAKFKKKLFEFIKLIQNTECVDQNKFNQVIKTDIRRLYSYRFDFYYPPLDPTYINKNNFSSYWDATHTLIHQDIYKDDNCYEYLDNEMNKLFGENNVRIITAMIHGHDITQKALFHEKLIMVRSDVHFEMHEWDKDNLINCLEAICAKNQGINYKAGFKPNLYDEKTLDTLLYITIFNEDGIKKSQFSIKIKDLLSGEDPQREIQVPGGHLAVDPFSKAATMQRDLSRELWRQRTSESSSYDGKSI